MLQSSNNGRTNNQPQTCPPTGADEYDVVHGAALPPSRRSPQLGEGAAGCNSVSAPDDDDDATISDDELVLKPSNLVQAARFHGTWLFKIEYHASSLSSAFFGQLLIVNNRLSRLAETASFSGDQCHVKWRSEWVPLFEPELPDNYRTFARRLDAIIAGEDKVRWYSDDCTYTVNGLNDRHHMCLNSCWRCTDIATVSMEGEVSSCSLRQ